MVPKLSFWCNFWESYKSLITQTHKKIFELISIDEKWRMKNNSLLKPNFGFLWSFFWLETITPASSFSPFLTVPPFRRGWSANWTSGAVMFLTIQPPPPAPSQPYTDTQICTPRVLHTKYRPVKILRGWKKGGRDGQRYGGRRKRKECEWTLGGNDAAILFTLPGANTCTHVLVPFLLALRLNCG